MLYYLFRYLNELDFPGAGMFDYISFRSSLAMILSLFIASFFGKKIIYFLQKQQIGEVVRDLGLEGQMQKKGTPTMGGVIIILACLIPVLLFARLDNVYIILLIISLLWMGLIGFIDDYIKVFKQNKDGLHGKFKIIGQVGLGLIVGLTLYINDDVVIREKIEVQDTISVVDNNNVNTNEIHTHIRSVDVKSTKTTIPFMKNNEFDYEYLVSGFGEYSSVLAWIIFIIITIFIVTAVSNGANITDGLDGLAAGSSAIIGVTLGVLAYLSGHVVYADYLNIMFIPNSGELVVFISAFVGSLVGFLWYNSYPAQVFMGDTGSLSIGGVIAVFAIIIHKELLIPLLCGVFLIENISVILQVSWFKYTRKKYGVGKRIFKMAPLHHHYQMQGYPESKIVTRFWIIGIFLAVLTIVTLKIR